MYRSIVYGSFKAPLVILHILALHTVGSNNPDGIDVGRSQKIPFHPGFRRPPYDRLLKMVSGGSMVPEQYDETRTDVVNFLMYASEPKPIQRGHLDYWVLLFLVILFVFAALLKKSH